MERIWYDYRNDTIVITPSWQVGKYWVRWDQVQLVQVDLTKLYYIGVL